MASRRARAREREVSFREQPQGNEMGGGPGVGCLKTGGG